MEEGERVEKLDGEAADEVGVQALVLVQEEEFVQVVVEQLEEEALG